MCIRVLEGRDCDERIRAEQVKSTRGDLGDTACQIISNSNTAGLIAQRGERSVVFRIV